MIDDVKLTEQVFFAPVAIDDSATTNQGQSVIIDILNNDRDDDGTIAADSVQITTQPNNSLVIKVGKYAIAFFCLDGDRKTTFRCFN